MMHSSYPDYILRFLRRDKCSWPPVIHAAPKVDGNIQKVPASRMELAFEHLANDSVADIIRKNNTYSDYGSHAVVRRTMAAWLLSIALLFDSSSLISSNEAA